MKSKLSFKVPKFDGTENGFFMWTKQFISWLKWSGYSSYLNLAETDDGMEGSAKGEWETKTDMFYALLDLCLDEPSRQLICSQAEGNGAKAWRILKDYFNSQSKIRITSLRRELHALRLEDASDPSIFCTKVNELVKILREMGSSITDDDVEELILSALPESYKDFIRSYSMSANQSLADLQGQLKLDFQRSGQKVVVSEESALAVTGQTCQLCGKIGHSAKQCQLYRVGSSRQSQGGGLAKYAEKVCFYCKQKGHIRPDCELLKKHKREIQGLNARSNKDEQPLALMVHDDKNHFGQQSLSLVVDSGASSHMFPYAELFEDLQLASHRTVQIADATSIAVKGVGNVSGVIRTQEGRKLSVVFKNGLLVPGP